MEKYDKNKYQRKIYPPKKEEKELEEKELDPAIRRYGEYLAKKRKEKKDFYASKEGQKELQKRRDQKNTSYEQDIAKMMADRELSENEDTKGSSKFRRELLKKMIKR